MNHTPGLAGTLRAVRAFLGVAITILVITQVPDLRAAALYLLEHVLQVVAAAAAGIFAALLLMVGLPKVPPR